MKAIYFIQIFFLFFVIPVFGIETRKLVLNSQYYKLSGIPEGLENSYLREELEARGIDSVFIGKTLIVVNGFYQECNKILDKIEFEDYKVIEKQEEHSWEYYKDLYIDVDNIVFLNFNKDGVSLHFISEESEMIRYSFFSENQEFFSELFWDIDAFLKLEDRLYKYPVSRLKMNIPIKKWVEISKRFRELSESIKIVSISNKFVKVELVILETNRRNIINMVKSNG